MYLPRDFPSNEFHQRHHSLIRVVMTTDDPYHSDGVHHRRQSVESDTERPLTDVFEVALKGGQEPGTVRSLYTFKVIFLRGLNASQRLII